MLPIAVVAVVEAHWGWSIRGPGYSAGGPALLLPPPSTVAAALLAHALASACIPEVFRSEQDLVYSSKIISEATITASAGLLKGHVVISRDTVKYLTIPYQSPDNRKNPSLWFAAQAFGIAVAPGSELCLAAVYDEDILAGYGIGPEQLSASAYSTVRLGSREGLVTVKRITVTQAERVEAAGSEETILYAPQGVLVKSTGISLYPMEVWDPWSPVAYRPTAPRGVEPVPKTLLVEVPVDNVSGGNIILAPRRPARIRSGITAFLARGAPERCSYIPVLTQ